MRSIANAFVGLTLIAGSSFCLAQSEPTHVSANAAATPASVQVTSQGDQLEVKVPDQAPLSTVMSSLCQEQKIKCTGTETLTSYRGPAMSVEGTLRQVIAKLVEGTDVNYEFSRTAEGGATAIAFLGHAPKGSAPVPTPEAPATPAFTPLHSRPFPGGPPPGATPPPQAPPQSELEGPSPDINPVAPAPVTTAGTEASADSAKQNAVSAATMLSEGGAEQQEPYMPFPDAQGHPVPVSTQAPAFLPFPDQNGNAIPVKPGPSGSPFPDAGSTNSSSQTKQ